MSTSSDLRLRLSKVEKIKLKELTIFYGLKNMSDFLRFAVNKFEEYSLADSKLSEILAILKKNH